jgi:hypothetical protein
LRKTVGPLAAGRSERFLPSIDAQGKIFLDFVQKSA